MHVLHVIPSISVTHGGPSRAIVTIERALSAKGCRITTLTTDDDGPGRRRSASAQRVNLVGVSRIYRRKWFDVYKIAPGILPWLWRHLETFDVVHIHALFSFTSIAAALLARWRGVPYIVRPLGTLSTYGMTKRRPLLKRLSFAVLETPVLRAAAAVHFTSQAERKEAEALGIPLRGVTLSLPVDLEVAGCADDWLRSHPEFQGRRIILYLSRIDPKKNVEGLLDAFASVRVRFSDVILVIAGDGAPAYVEQLKASARTLGLGADVVWVGHVDGQDKSGLLSAAELFVLLSFSENFGIAAAEAMLAGLPCVLGEGVAIAEQARVAGSAFIVEPKPDAIAKAIEHLLDNESERIAMGVRASEMAEREFSMKATAERFIKLYKEVSEAKRLSSR